MMTQEQFKKIINICTTTDNIQMVVKCAMDIAGTKNPYFICDFAEFVPLANDPSIMSILEDGIIATGDIVHCYEFAFCMADHDKKFNLACFENLMIESKRAKLMYYFMECVKGANIQKLTNSFLHCTDGRWLEEYLNNDEVPKIYYTKELSSFCQEDTLFKLYFSKYNIGGGRYSALHYKQAAIASHDPEFIVTAAEYMHDQNLFDAIMATDDLLHIYEYYCAVPNLSEHQKNSILIYLKNNNYINSAKYMYYVSEYTDLPAHEVEDMLKAARKTGNREYIDKIAATLQRKSNQEYSNN